MFLHIWLRREEQRVKLALMMAAGLAETSNAGGVQSSIPSRFKEYLEAVFPFVSSSRSESEKKMLDAMHKEVAKGPLKIEAVELNPFKQTVKKMQIPDEFRQRLEEKVRKQQRLR